MNEFFEHSSNGKRLISQVKELYPYLSRKHISDLINNGAVLVNGLKKKPNYKVKPDDTLSFVSIPTTKEIALKPNPNLAPKILYEDDYIVAVEKPRGMPTHPNRFDETNTLANGLIATFPNLEKVGKGLECGLLNRLDNDTSGILLAAKTPRAYTAFKESFGKKKVFKEYIALVQGHPPDHGRIDKPLKHDPKNKRKMLVSPKTGRGIYAAATDFKAIRRFKEFSLVLLSLNSAVTHQIRIHLASIGHSIAGDSIYATKSPKPVEVKDLKGHFLHASQVKFRHPFLKKEITVKSELPEQLQRILEGV